MQKTMPFDINSTQENTLCIDISKYGGGVAIWGAIPAVYDTTSLDFDAGIHVHARNNNSRQKVIDKTFKTVKIKSNGKYFNINAIDAIYFAMSSIYQLNITTVYCDSCMLPILDTGLNAVITSFKHTCDNCHQITISDTSCVSNPLMAVKKELNDREVVRSCLSPNRSISLNDERFFEGDIQLWGSNPAVLWTASTPEESGIHVHIYNKAKKRIVDNTYDHVLINDIKIDCQMLRTLQVQRAIPQISYFLTTLHCPQCEYPVYHQNIFSIRPSIKHNCIACKYTWHTKPMISNPLLQTLMTFNKKGFK